MNQVELKKKQIEMFSCIIGMIGWIIMGNFLGENGIAYFAVAYETFLFFQMLFTHMLADTMGKLLRSRTAKGQYKNAAKFKKNVMIYELGVGIGSSVLLAVLAGVLGEMLFGLSYSVAMIWILAPALFIRTMVVLLLGCFQGEGTELPTVISYIMRQVSTFLFALLFVGLLRKYGEKVSALLRKDDFTAMYGGIGMAVAVLVSELVVFLFLFLVYRGSRGGARKGASDGMRMTDNFTSQLRALGAGRLPFMITAMLQHLPIWLGLLFYRKYVTELVELDQYGFFYGKYLPVVIILISVVLIFLTGCCHRVVGCVRREEQRYTKNYFAGGFHGGVMYGIFLSLFAMIMSPQLADIVGGTSDLPVTQMLQGGSLVIFFSIMGYYFSEILLLLNGKLQVIGPAVLKNLVFLVAVLLMLNNSSAGMMSLVYGSVLAEAVFAVTTGVLLYMQLRVGIDWVRQLVIPAGCACVAGLVVWLVSKAVSPHLGSFISMILCLVIGAACYVIALLLMRDFRDQDFAYLPGGKLLQRLGQMMRVY